MEFLTFVILILATCEAQAKKCDNDGKRSPEVQALQWTTGGFGSQPSTLDQTSSVGQTYSADSSTLYFDQTSSTDTSTTVPAPTSSAGGSTIVFDQTSPADATTTIPDQSPTVPFGGSTLTLDQTTSGYFTLYFDQTTSTDSPMTSSDQTTPRIGTTTPNEETYSTETTDSFDQSTSSDSFTISFDQTMSSAPTTDVYQTTSEDPTSSPIQISTDRPTTTPNEETYSTETTDSFDQSTSSDSFTISFDQTMSSAPTTDVYQTTSEDPTSSPIQISTDRPTTSSTDGTPVTGTLSDTTPDETATIDVDCYPNGTIVVSNFDSDLLRGVVANNSVGLCNTTFSEDFQFLFITGCNLGEDILLGLSTVHGGIIGGSTAVVYLIHCSDIPETGFRRQFIQGVTPILVTQRPETVTPDVAIFSGLRDDFAFGSPERFQAVLSTRLFWTIDIPVQYYGLPTYCKVVSGTDVNDVTALSKDIIFDGCSRDLSLVSHFGAVTTNAIYRRLYTNFYVFKFYDSDFITIKCTVAYCRQQMDCEMGCGNGRRRRDANKASVDSHKTTTTATLKVIDGNFHFHSGTINTVPWNAVHLLVVAACSHVFKTVLSHRLHQ